ncbi:MAG: hypothetical protein R3202_02385 [Candidatus Competibacterales bacterium]|nr:hypothetical protein [Candidatus Competibacterales bacterium]
MRASNIPAIMLSLMILLVGSALADESLGTDTTAAPQTRVAAER